MPRVKKTDTTEDLKKKNVKPAVKTAVKDAVVKGEPAVKGKPVKQGKNLTVDVYGLDGKVTGTITLPEEIFGEKVNKQLLAQAVRVYLANKRQGTVSTKTRSEVDGSTAKIYRQKGTGRARHGSKRAPIFVHGGVAFGPKPRDFSLKLSKKMKRKALYNALSVKLADGEIKILSGLEALEPKTKQFMGVIGKLGLDGKKRSVLLVSPSELENVKLAARNVQGITYTAVQRINVYDILKYKQLLVMKESIDEMKKYFLSEQK